MKYTVYKHGWDDTDPEVSIPFNIEYETFDNIVAAKAELAARVAEQDDYLEKQNDTSFQKTVEETFVKWSRPDFLIEIGIHSHN